MTSHQTVQPVDTELHTLNERVKELNCLYGISTLVEQAGASLSCILAGTVALIPPAWQYPQITCARITLDGQVYSTANFCETAWKLAQDISVHRKPTGTIEVYYLEERLQGDEGPFFREERNLLNAVAERLGRVVERIRAEERVAHINRILRAIRNVNQLITREKDRNRLIQRACDALVETRGYYNAWVVLLDVAPASAPASTAEFVAAASAGIGDDFTALLGRLAGSDKVYCIHLALAQEGVCTIADPLSTCTDCPLAAKYAGRAALVVRLQHNQVIYGVLVVSVSAEFAVDEEERALLEEVAGDIALALHEIEVEERRQQAEAALNQALAESRQHQKEIAALLTGAQAVLKHRDFETAAGVIFAACKEATGATAGYVALLSADGAENEVLFLDSGGRECTVDPDLPMSIRGLRAEAYRTGRAVYDNAFSTGARMRFMPPGHAPLENVLFAPLVVEAQVVGLVGLGNKPGGFTAADARIASAFGEFAAIAFHNSRTLEALRGSEERFRGVFATSPTGIAIVNTANQQFLEVNASFVQIVGYPQEELRHMTVMDITHPEDRDKELVLIKSYLDGELPSYAVEKRYIRKDGAIRWVRTMGDIMWVAADQPPLAIANVVDITAHRQMEETLRESEDQYRLLAETTRDIILLHDMEGRITYVNRAGLHFGGFSEAEALGKPITAFMPPDRLAEIAERRARRAASDDTTFLYETEFVDNAGRRVPVEVNSTPALRGGKPAQMLIVARDITARKQAENALRAERDLVSRIIETSPACITMVNRAGQIVFANPQAEPVLGLSRDVIHQRTYNDPEWRITAYNGGPFPEDELPFAQAQRTLRPVNDVRHAIEWPDGRRVLLRINAAPMLDESGAFNGIISSIEDVTERVQAQEALQASEQRYRALFEQMTEGFALHEIILDEDEQPCDYRFLHVNRAFEQLTGLQAEDLVGRTVLEALPDTEPYWIETYGQVALTGQPLHFENYSGALGKYYDVTAYSPEPGRFATVFTDITERKRVENELQRRVAQLALLNDIGEQVAAVLELDKVFERAVDLVHESFGYHHVSIFTLEQEHLTIRAKAGSLAHLLPAGHRLKLGQGIVGWVGMHGETLLANDVAIEPRYVNFYGDVIPTRAELSVPICIGGEVVGVLDAQSPQRNAFDDSDVMVMKTLADQVAVAIQNARLYEKQERYGVRLQSSNQELEQFAYVASHDLQEPLRAISGYLELLERRYGDQLDERGQRFIAYAVDGAARMHELIRSLLDYSRIGAQGWQPGRVDGEAVFVQVLAGLTKAIQENNAVITHDPLPVVTGDPIQLRRVLQNLVGNAIKFHDSEPPRVHVAVERAEDEWRFSVRDNGIGIAPEQIGRLFAIFQRLHTREEYPGAGIGLAICKKIVERHGGRIWVESAPGRGATFYFTLPTGETDR